MWTSKYIIPLALVFASCQSSEEQAPQATEPVPKPLVKSKVYQPSELALEMRSIYANLKIVGHELKNGESISDSLLMGYERILTAKGTDPSDTDESFQAFANQWLNAVNTFKENPSEENYNMVMDGCVACHEQRCPGPIPKINRLKL